jgi:protection of telomeres protein 1
VPFDNCSGISFFAKASLVVLSYDVIVEGHCLLLPTMALSPPAGFVDLTTAYSQKDKALNVMGVVVDHLPAAKSGGPDFIITFTIHDPSWTDGLGLKFAFFHKLSERLPAIETNGDVVLLRNIKVKNYRGGWIGISNSTTTWAVFPENLLPESSDQLSSGGINVKKSPSAASPTQLETEYAVHLCNSRRGTFALPPPPTSLQLASITKEAGIVPAKRREKFSLIQDLSLPEQGTGFVFADLLGEVRKSFENDFCVELSITDYTTNKALYNYAYGCDEDGTEGDQFGYLVGKQKTWPGPWGKMTMNVRMWDAHANFARSHVKLGDFIFLRNVHIGTGKDGKHYMEGKLRGDPNDLDRVGVKVYRPRDGERDVRMKELLARKRDYEIKAKREHKEFVRDASKMPKKRLDSETGQPDSGSRKTKSNKERKMERKLAKASTGLDTLALTEAKKLESNGHVRCQNVNVPLKSTEEIMDPEILRRKTPSGNDFYLPFQNCCYHSKVRVVDYLPNDIANFACPYRTSDYDILSENEGFEGSDMDTDEDGDVKWEWRFYLIVEDATSPATAGQPKVQMPLLVADTDGDFLLDMEASDLRKDPRKLAQVREKLFVLWGDLQEQKETTGNPDLAANIKPSAKPFECLIKEYGIPARDEHGHLKGPLEFDRVFRLWGATVK